MKIKILDHPDYFKVVVNDDIVWDGYSMTASTLKDFLEEIGFEVDYEYSDVEVDDSGPFFVDED